MTNINTDFYKEFMTLVESGDETAARTYLTENFAQFPVEIQEKITYAFFAEALEQKVVDVQVANAVQNKGTSALSVLEQATSDLESQSRIDELREELNA